MAHLVVGAAAAVEFERLGCPPVGEAGAAGLGAQVNCGGPTRWCRGDNGQKSGPLRRPLMNRESSRAVTAVQKTRSALPLFPMTTACLSAS